MIYVMSDLHGCKNEFDAMLELIGFSDYDELCGFFPEQA